MFRTIMGTIPGRVRLHLCFWKMIGTTGDVPGRRFSIARTARVWFRDSVRYRGLGGTVRELTLRVFDFIRDMAPSRRRLRFGDLQYRFADRVDTTWSNLRLRTKMRELFSGEQYQPIEPEQFHSIIEARGI